MPQIPGLLAVLPPKRAARGREDDRLLVYLTLSGNTRFPSAEYNQIMGRITQRFYQTSGSLTSAMRAAAGELNQSLLKRNLHTTGKGEYVVGRLILGVLRGAQFLFAQCGPTHVFHLTGVETRQIHDEQIAGRGLGIGQATPLYFAQVDLHAGDLLVLCPNLPTGWDATLLGERNVSSETLRRNLLSISSDDLNAVLVQVQAGKGNLNILNRHATCRGEACSGSPDRLNCAVAAGKLDRLCRLGSNCAASRSGTPHGCLAGHAHFAGGERTSGQSFCTHPLRGRNSHAFGQSIRH